MSDPDAERQRKLQAGREKLLQFQRQKKKKKREEASKKSSASHQGSKAQSKEDAQKEGIGEKGPSSSGQQRADQDTDNDAASLASSVGSPSYPGSPVPQEGDQRSYTSGSEYTSGDESYSYSTDGGGGGVDSLAIAHLEVNELQNRVIELEETLRGKQAALKEVNKENYALKTQLSNFNQMTRQQATASPILHGEVEQLREVLRQKQRTLDEMTEENIELRRKLIHQPEDKSESSQLEELQTNLKSKQCTLEALNQQNEDLSKEVTSLRKLLKGTASSEFDNLQETLKSKNLIVAELNKQNKELQAKLEALKIGSTGDSTSYKHKFEAAFKELSEYKEDFAKRQTLKENLIRTQEELKTTLRSVLSKDSEINLMDEQLVIKCRELEEVKEKCDKLATKVRDLEILNNDMITQIKDHEGHIDHLCLDNRAKTARINELESHLSLAIGERDAVHLEANTQVEDLTEQIRHLKEQIAYNIDATKHHEDQVSGATLELENAQSLISELKLTIQQQKDEIEKLKTEVRKSGKKKQQEFQQLSVLHRNEMEALKSSLEKKQSQIFELNRKLDLALNDLQTSRTQFQKQIEELEELVNFKEDEVSKVTTEMEARLENEILFLRKDYDQRFLIEQEKWELEASEKLEEQKKRHEESFQALQEEVRLLEQQRDSALINSDGSEQEKLDSQKSQIECLMAQLEEQKELADTLTQEVSKLTKHLEEEQSRAQQCYNEIEKFCHAARESQSKLEIVQGELDAERKEKEKKAIQQSDHEKEKLLFREICQDWMQSLTSLRSTLEARITNKEKLDFTFLDIDSDFSKKLGTYEKHEVESLFVLEMEETKELDVELKKLAFCIEEQTEQLVIESEGLHKKCNELCILHEEKTKKWSEERENLVRGRNDLLSQLDVMKQDRAGIIEEYERKLEELTCGFENEVKRLEMKNKELESSFVMFKEQWTKDVAEALNTSERTVDEMRGDFEEQMTTLTRKLEEEQELAVRKVTEDKEAEMRSLILKHERRLAEVIDNAEKEKSQALALQREESAAEEEARFNQKLQELVQERTQSAAQLEAELQKQLEEIRREKDVELASIQEQYEEGRGAQVTEAEELLLEQLNKLQGEYRNLQERFVEVEEDLEKTCLETVSARAQLTEAKETSTREAGKHLRFLEVLRTKLSCDDEITGQDYSEFDDVEKSIFKLVNDIIESKVEISEALLGFKEKVASKEAEEIMVKESISGINNSLFQDLPEGKDLSVEDEDVLGASGGDCSLQALVKKLQFKLQRATQEKEGILYALQKELDNSKLRVSELEVELDLAQSFGDITSIDKRNLDRTDSFSAVSAKDKSNFSKEFIPHVVEEPEMVIENVQNVQGEQPDMENTRDDEISSLDSGHAKALFKVSKDISEVENLMRQIKYLEKLLVEKNEIEESQKTQIRSLMLEMENERKLFAQQLRSRQEKELSQSMQDLQFAFGGGRGLALKGEVAQLEQRLKEKERTESELKAENARLVCLVKENNLDLIGEKETLQQQLLKQEEIIQQLQEKMNVSSTVTSEIQEAFGKQLTALYKQRNSLIEKLDQQKSSHEGLAKVIQEKAALEETLRFEKEVLREKLTQKEQLEQELKVEKERLHEKLIELEKLREILIEKDKMSAELEEQRDELQTELDAIEQSLIEREVELSAEKEKLEDELSQRNTELAEWEVKFKERERKYFSDIDILKKQHDENLEFSRTDLERSHLDKVKRLRMELDEDYHDRVRTLETGHKEEMEHLKQEQEEQVADWLDLTEWLVDSMLLLPCFKLSRVKSDFESQLLDLRKRLEEERYRQLSTVKTVLEREHKHEMMDLETGHESEMNAFKEEMRRNHLKEIEQARSALNEEHARALEELEAEVLSYSTINIEAAKIAAEKDYERQMESLREELTRYYHRELERLREEHAGEVERARQACSAEARENMQRKLEEVEEAHRREIASLTADSVQQFQTKLRDMEATLTSKHNRDVESTKAEIEAQYLKDLSALKEELKQANGEDLLTALNEFESTQEKYFRERLLHVQREHEENTRTLEKRYEAILLEMNEEIETMKQKGLEEKSAMRLQIEQQLGQIASLEEEIVHLNRRITVENAVRFTEQQAAFDVDIANLKRKYDAELAKRDANHGKAVDILTAELEAIRKEMEKSSRYLDEEIEKARAEQKEIDSRQSNEELEIALKELRVRLQQDFDIIIEQVERKHKAEKNRMIQKQEEDMETMKEQVQEQCKSELKEKFAEELEALRRKAEEDRIKGLSAVATKLSLEHAQNLENVKQGLKRKHEKALDRIRLEMQRDFETNSLRQAEQIEELELKHFSRLNLLKKEMRQDHAAEVTKLEERYESEIKQLNDVLGRIPLDIVHAAYEMETPSEVLEVPVRDHSTTMAPTQVGGTQEASDLIEPEQVEVYPVTEVERGILRALKSLVLNDLQAQEQAMTLQRAELSNDVAVPGSAEVIDSEHALAGGLEVRWSEKISHEDKSSPTLCGGKTVPVHDRYDSLHAASRSASLPERSSEPLATKLDSTPNAGRGIGADGIVAFSVPGHEGNAVHDQFWLSERLHDEDMKDLVSRPTFAKRESALQCLLVAPREELSTESLDSVVNGQNSQELFDLLELEQLESFATTEVERGMLRALKNLVRNDLQARERIMSSQTASLSIDDTVLGKAEVIDSEHALTGGVEIKLNEKVRHTGEPKFSLVESSTVALPDGKIGLQDLKYELVSVIPEPVKPLFTRFEASETDSEIASSGLSQRTPVYEEVNCLYIPPRSASPPEVSTDAYPTSLDSTFEAESQTAVNELNALLLPSQHAEDDVTDNRSTFYQGSSMESTESLISRPHADESFGGSPTSGVVTEMISELQEKFNEQRTEIERRHRDEMEELKRSHKCELERLSSELQLKYFQELDRVQEAGDKREEEFVRLLHAKDRELERQQAQVEDAIAEAMDALLKRKDAELEDSQVRLMEHHQKVLDDFIREQEVEISELKRDHLEDVRRLQMKFESEAKENLASLEDQHEDALQDLRQRFETQLSQERKRHQEDVEALMSTSENDRGQMEEAVTQRLRAQHERQLDALREELKEEHEREMEALRDTLERDHQDVLEGARDDALKEARAEFDREVQQIKEATKSELEVEHLNNLRLLEDELEQKHIQQLKSLAENENNHREAIREIKADYEAKMEDLVAYNKAELDKLKENLAKQHDEEIDAINRDVEAEVSKAKEELDSAHKKEIQLLQNELNDVKAKLLSAESLLSGIEAAYSEAMTKMQRDYEREMDKLRRNLEAAQEGQLKTLEQAYSERQEVESKSLQDSLRVQLQELQAKCTQAEESMKEKMTKEFQEKLDSLTASHEKEMLEVRLLGENSLQDALDEYQSKKKDLENRITVLEEEREQNIGTTAELRATVGNLRAEKENLKKIVTEKEEEFTAIIAKYQRQDEERDNLIGLLTKDNKEEVDGREKFLEINNKLMDVINKSFNYLMQMEAMINTKLDELIQENSEDSEDALSDVVESPVKVIVTPSDPEDTADADQASKQNAEDMGGYIVFSGKPTVPSFAEDETFDTTQLQYQSIFAGPELDEEGVEVVEGLTERVGNAVGQILTMLELTTRQVSDTRMSYNTLIAQSAAREDEIQRIVDSHKDLLENLLSEQRARQKLNEELMTATNDLQSLKQESDEMRIGLEEKEDKLSATTVELRKLEDRIREMEDSHKDLDSSRKAAQERCMELECDKLHLSNSKNDLEFKLAELRTTMEGERYDLMRPDSARSHVDVEDEMDELRAENEELKRVIENLNEDKEDLKMQCCEIEEQRLSLCEERDTLRRDLAKVVEENEDLVDKNQTLRHQLGNLESALEESVALQRDAHEKFESLNLRLDVSSQDGSEVFETEEDALAYRIQKLEDELAVARKENEELRSRYDTLNDGQDGNPAHEYVPLTEPHLDDEVVAERDRLAAELADLEDCIESLKDRNDELANEVATKSERELELLENIANLEGDLEALQRNPILESFSSREEARLQDDLEMVRKERDELRNDVDLKDRELFEVKTRLEEALISLASQERIQDELLRLRSALNEKEDDLLQQETETKSVRQLLSDREKETSKLSSQLMELKNRVIEREALIDDQQCRLFELQAKQSDTESKDKMIIDLQKMVTDGKTLIEDQENEIQHLKVKLGTARDPADGEENSDRLKKIDAMSEQLQDQKKELQLLNALVEEKNASLRDKENIIEELQLQMKNYKERAEKEHDEEIKRLSDQHQLEKKMMMEVSSVDITDLELRLEALSNQTIENESDLADEVFRLALAGTPRMAEGSSTFREWLTRLRNEAGQLVDQIESLAISYPMVSEDVDETDFKVMQEGWAREKQALLAVVRALKDLVVRTSSPRPGDTTVIENDEDWRSGLLLATENVFEREMQAVNAELQTLTSLVRMGYAQEDLIGEAERTLEDRHQEMRQLVETLKEKDRDSLIEECRELRFALREMQAELKKALEKLQKSTAMQYSLQPVEDLTRQFVSLKDDLEQERETITKLNSQLEQEQNRSSELERVLAKERRELSGLKKSSEQQQNKFNELVNSFNAERDELSCLRQKLVEEETVVQQLEFKVSEGKSKISALEEALNAEESRNRELSDFGRGATNDLRRLLLDEQAKNNQLLLTIENEKADKMSLQDDIVSSRQSLEKEKGERQRLEAILERYQKNLDELRVLFQTEKDLRMAAEQSLVEKQDTELSEKQELSQHLEKEKEKSAELSRKLEKAYIQLASTEVELNAEKQMRADDKEVSKENEQLLTALEEEKARVMEMKVSLDDTRKNAELLLKQEQLSSVKLKDALDALQLQYDDARQQLDQEMKKVADGTLVPRSVLDNHQEELRRREEDLRRREASVTDQLVKLVEKEDELEKLRKELQSESRTGSSRMTASLHRQLVVVAQRLKEIVLKLHTLLALQKKGTTSKDSVDEPFNEIQAVQTKLSELLMELRQIQDDLRRTASESSLAPSSPDASREVLLEKLRTLENERSQFRSSLTNLESEVMMYRKRELTLEEASKAAKESATIALEQERNNWLSERETLKKTINEANAELAQIKALWSPSSSGSIDQLAEWGWTVSKVQKLYANYIRAESFRKALIYQKRYLLLVLGGFQETESATLSMLAKMGAASQENTLAYRKSQAHFRFRSAACVVIAIQRMRMKKRRREMRLHSKDKLKIVASRRSAENDKKANSSGELKEEPYTITSKRMEQKLGGEEDPVREYGSVIYRAPSGLDHLTMALLSENQPKLNGYHKSLQRVHISPLPVVGERESSGSLTPSETDTHSPSKDPGGSDLEWRYEQLKEYAKLRDKRSTDQYEDRGRKFGDKDMGKTNLSPPKQKQIKHDTSFRSHVTMRKGGAKEDSMDHPISLYGYQARSPPRAYPRPLSPGQDVKSITPPQKDTDFSSKRTTISPRPRDTIKQMRTQGRRFQRAESQESYSTDTTDSREPTATQGVADDPNSSLNAYIRRLESLQARLASNT